HRPALYAREPESESGVRGSDWQICATEESDTCPDRARLAARAKAVDCADPGNDQAGAPRRKHRSGQPGTFARRSPGTGDRSLKDRGARRSISRSAAKNGGPLSRKEEQKLRRSTGVYCGGFETKIGGARGEKFFGQFWAGL